MPFKAEDFKDDKDFAAYVAAQLKLVTDPLEASKTGLQTDITKLKVTVATLDGLDLAALKSDSVKLKQLLEDKRSKETDTEKALRIAREQHDTEMTTLKADVQALKGTNKKLLVDDGLKGALLKVNVKPVLVDAAVSLLKGDVSVVSENGVQVAKIGDKTLGEHVIAWAVTEVGKNFVLAKQNSGGGGGGDGDGTPPEEAARFFDKKSSGYNLTKQILLRKSDPELYTRLKKGVSA